MNIEKVDRLKKPTGFSRLNVIALKDAETIKDLLEVFESLLKIVQILYKVKFNSEEFILPVKVYDQTNFKELDEIDGYEIYTDFFKSSLGNDYTCVIAFYSKDLSDPMTFIMHILDDLDITYSDTHARNNIRVLVKED